MLRTAHSPVRLNKNAPLAIVAELPSFCRSFMTKTWLGTSPPASPPSLASPPPLPAPPSCSPTIPFRLAPPQGCREPSRVLWLVAEGDKSRLASVWRFLNGTGSRGWDDLGWRCDVIPQAKPARARRQNALQACTHDHLTISKKGEDCMRRILSAGKLPPPALGCTYGGDANDGCGAFRLGISSRALSCSGAEKVNT